MSRNSSNPTDPSEAATLMQRATWASLSVAIVLIVVKLSAWSATGSVSLLASLIDSTLDALASLINLIAVRHAVSPADSKHRFGHGKAEAIAGLAQAALIAGSATFILVESAGRLLDPPPLEAHGVGIAVMVFAIAATLALLMFQRYVIRKTDSTAIKADALHYKTDLLVNSSVIVALILANVGWPGFDALLAAAIAVYILWSAWGIVEQALDHLMDSELPDERRREINDIVQRHPEVRGLHDLKTRRAGIAVFIQLHLELDDDLRLLEAHRISDAVEHALLENFPGAEIIIHVDPLSVVATEPMQSFPDNAQH